MTTPDAEQATTLDTEQAKKNPFTSALAWLTITLAILAFVFVLTAAGVEAQARAYESSEVSLPTAQGALLYAWAGSCAGAAFLTFVAWLVARAATWRAAD